MQAVLKELLARRAYRREVWAFLSSVASDRLAAEGAFVRTMESPFEQGSELISPRTRLFALAWKSLERETRASEEDGIHGMDAGPDLRWWNQLESVDRALLLLSSEELNSAGQKGDYEASLDILETLIRDAMMLSLGVQDDQIVNDDLRPQLAKVAEHINARTAADWIAKIEELREQLVVKINRKVATDALLLSMASG